MDFTKQFKKMDQDADSDNNKRKPVMKVGMPKTGQEGFSLRRKKLKGPDTADSVTRSMELSSQNKSRALGRRGLAKKR